MSGPTDTKRFWLTTPVEMRGPYYLQLSEQIRRAIANGELTPGQPLPSERELADILQTSRTTIRKALGILVAEDLLDQRHGSGTFVTRRLETTLTSLRSFSEDMRARGLEPSSRVVNKTISHPTPEEILALNIPMDARVLRYDRIRYAGETPMAIERLVIDQRLVGDPELIGPSLYQTLRRRGFMPVRAVQRTRAGAVNEEDARLLGLTPGVPALFFDRQSYLADGTVVEKTKSTYRGDTYEFVAELRMSEDLG